MASAEETAFDDEGFTHAEDVLADGELVGPEPVLDPNQPVTDRNQPVLDRNQPVTDRNQPVLDPNQPLPDPTPVAPKELKDEAEGEGRRDCGNGAHNLKSTLLISGAAVAILGAIFAIAKKIKEA